MSASSSRDLELAVVQLVMTHAGCYDATHPRPRDEVAPPRPIVIERCEGRYGCVGEYAEKLGYVVGRVDAAAMYHSV